MIQILDIRRDNDNLVLGKETMAIRYTGDASGEPVYCEITDFKGTVHDGYVTFHDRTNKILYVREIPYTLGTLSVQLRQPSGKSSEFNYFVEEIAHPGIPLPFTVNISHTKNPDPIVVASQIRGGHHVFDDQFDFLHFPKERMEPTMTASVKSRDGIIRTYSLNWVDIVNMPWPLKDIDAGEQGSFRNYWHLQSESKIERPHITQVEYAPDYMGGMPPYYENPSESGFDRYTFPPGSEWNEEREFTDTKWTAEQKPEHTWKRVKESGGTVWSMPIPINANSENYVQENRFIRAFEKPHQEDSQIALYSFYRGEPNLFASFDMYGRIFTFSDRQPARRVWDDLTTEEQQRYSALYGPVTDPNNEEMLGRINQLYMTIATKDIHGNLRSSWSQPMLLPEGDGNLVRYSHDGKGDINAVRERIIHEGITVPAIIDTMYSNAGWVRVLQFGVHNYMAYRSSTSEEWQVRKTANELGQYTKDYYKPYPINYYDRIHNIRTRGNYVPVGINAKNNPEDDITQFNWTDGPPDVPKGYELYRATAVLSFDGTKLLGDWTITLNSGRTPLVDWISSSHDMFRKHVENTANGNPDTIRRDPEEIEMWANLTLDGEDVFSLSHEDIRFEWRRIYNAGNPDDTVIFNNFGKAWDLETGSYKDDPDTLVTGSKVPQGFRILEDGKRIVVDHGQVDYSAIFELTLWRDVAGNRDFEGTGLNWVPYKSEKTLGDIVDTVVRSVVVSAERYQFVYSANKEGQQLERTDFIGGSSINIKAFATNVDYSNGKWYVWNRANDFNLLKETMTPAQWKEVESSKAPNYWTDLGDSDLNHNVLWNSDGFDLPDVSMNVYKFQATTPQGNEVFDYVTIFKTKDGTSARDIKIMPEQFAVPLTSDASAYDGVSRKVFKVTADNITSPVYAWELKDKNGTILATAAGDTFIFEADPSKRDGAEHYAPTGLEDFKNRSPYTLAVSESSTPMGRLVEEALVVSLMGGNLAIKGEDGEGGLQVVYDPNDLVPSDNLGNPIGTVDERTTVLVYKGSVPQPIGTSAGRFSVQLTEVPQGVTASVSGGNEIRVTKVTTAPKDVIKFKVVEGGSRPIVDASNRVVEFPFTLVKSMAGESNWVLMLSNESQVTNITESGEMVRHTLDGVQNTLAKTEVRLLRGSKTVTLNAAQCIFKVNGVTLQQYSTNNDFTLFWSPVLGSGIYVRANKGNGALYVTCTESASSRFPSIFDLEITEPVSGNNLTKDMVINTVVSPSNPRRIEIIPRTGTAFYPSDAASKELVFDVKFFEGTREVGAWTTPVVKVNGSVKTAMYSNGVLRVKKSETVQNTAITLESGQAVGYVQIVDIQEGEGMAILYCRDATLNLGGANTSADPFKSLGSPLSSVTYAAVKGGSAGYSVSSNSRTWYKNSSNAVWAVWRSSSDTSWSAPFKLTGEKGEKGASLVDVTVYRASDSMPALPTGLALPPTGWTLSIPTSGKIWAAKRTYEFVGNNKGQYGPAKEYNAFAGSSWSAVYRFTGEPGTHTVNVYAKGSGVRPATPAFTTEGSIASPWSKTVTGAGAGSADYIWISTAEFTDGGSRIGGWATPAVFRFPQPKDGERGPKGDKGDAGARGPAGPQGPKGDRGATGPTGARGPTGPQGPKGDQGVPGVANVKAVIGGSTSWVQGQRWHYLDLGDSGKSKKVMITAWADFQYASGNSMLLRISSSATVPSSPTSGTLLIQRGFIEDVHRPTVKQFSLHHFVITTDRYITLMVEPDGNRVAYYGLKAEILD